MLSEWLSRLISAPILSSGDSRKKNPRFHRVDVSIDDKTLK